MKQLSRRANRREFSRNARKTSKRNLAPKKSGRYI